MTTYNSVLKESRLKKKLSQAKVRKDTGIAVSNIETGKTDTKFTTVCKLARYYEVSIYLLERAVK